MVNIILIKLIGIVLFSKNYWVLWDVPGYKLEEYFYNLCGKNLLVNIILIKLISIVLFGKKNIGFSGMYLDKNLKIIH